MPYQEIHFDREALSVWKRERLEEIGKSIYREITRRGYLIVRFDETPKGVPESVTFMGKTPLPYNADIKDITSRLGITFSLGKSHDDSWNWEEE